MKKFLFASLLFVSGAAYAEPLSVSRSSSIAGTTHTGCIQGKYLDKVLVPTATAGGNLRLYNSTWTLSSPEISSITLATVGMYDFNAAQVNGICYNASLPTNGVVIIYKK